MINSKKEWTRTEMDYITAMFACFDFVKMSVYLLWSVSRVNLKNEAIFEC